MVGPPWGPTRTPIHVVTTRTTSRRSQLARVHRVRELDPRWVTDLNGVLVARPELAALQLFASYRYERAERMVESMWAQRLISGCSIGLLVGDLGRRGRNGTAGLRRFYEQRGNDYRPPDSGLESRVQQILRAAGIEVRRQVDLGGEGHWTGRGRLLSCDAARGDRGSERAASLLDPRSSPRRSPDRSAAGRRVRGHRGDRRDGVDRSRVGRASRESWDCCCPTHCPTRSVTPESHPVPPTRHRKGWAGEGWSGLGAGGPPYSAMVGFPSTNSIRSRNRRRWPPSSYPTSPGSQAWNAIHT